MPSQKIVMISGANRGLGRAFLERYLARPNHTVIAAVRNPDHPTSQELLKLSEGTGSAVHVVKVDSTSKTDATEAVKELRVKGVSHIDLVYANAGIATVMPTVSELEIEDLQTHMVTNVYGIIRLYQATLPLLKASKQPTWVSIGGKSGCLNDFFALPNAAFGITKVATHWLTLAIHSEEPEITAFAMNPGLVQTDMGNFGAQIAAAFFKKPELADSALPIDVSVDGVVNVVDAATRETHSGKFWTHEGEVVAW